MDDAEAGNSLPKDVDPGSVHQPVLLAEVLELFALRPGMIVVDGTIGAGGHSSEFLRRILPGGFLLGLDRDPQSVELATRNLTAAGYVAGKDFDIEASRFSRFDAVLERRGLEDRLDRLFVDLGVCSFQIDRAERGFSFKRDGNLDMRMNPLEEETDSAATLVNEAGEAELARIFKEFGEEKFARRIAKAIVEQRAERPFETTLQLQATVARAIPRAAWPPKTDPATRVFQALRIAVNGELDELSTFLGKVPEALLKGRPQAMAGILTFHSLEDRPVKKAFVELCRSCTCPPELPVCRCGGKASFGLATAKPRAASDAELDHNPRARSARLRGIRASSQ